MTSSRYRVHSPLLVIGAGPFGLAMAAHAKGRGIDHLVVGRPMSFWREHMPKGMILRSACDWHLDPADRDTIERFLATRGQTPGDVEPLSLAFYLDYAEWFQARKGLRVRDARVIRLERSDMGFAARLDDGDVVTADRVLLALGLAPFAHVPEALAAIVPRERRSHTRDCAAPDRWAGRRVLVVGGRQSAFETGALLAEAGAAAVHVCLRHETPAFETSDWTWVEPTLDRIEAEPGWYRALPESEREGITAHFFAEGRRKLEPWLGPRVRHPAIEVRPMTEVAGAEERGDTLRVRLLTGETLDVDHVMFATGYKVDLERVPFLAGELLRRIERREGYPILDDTLQTTVPGLFVTSLPAARDFGLFFGFTVAVRASARMVALAF